MPSDTNEFDLNHIDSALESTLLVDRQKLRNQYRNILQQQKQNQQIDHAVSRLVEKLRESQNIVLEKQNNLPEITFPEELPISQKKDDIARLIGEHQVIILAGETGSGKTTQVPKICLSLGLGINGMIGHTQPRRIAARTVASRIAEELKVELGGSVGYQVRFTDHSSKTTHIKLMTDGILLAEIQQDPLLMKYDALIIDEAHERSLNIDFLLGYLKQILPKRPDLKIIVTSATIDLERFSNHFDNAPVIEVSGRMYPVEVRYEPWQDQFEDVNDAIVDAVHALLDLSKGQGGDILIFLSGEREIREASHAIKKAGFPHLEILPLYARLSLAEQNRVFQPHKGRRVVLATNVAETSITVPGIRYVIDPGTARIKRYSLRTKVQRLPIEAISQASAEQRKGRCGRVSAGVCIRLYDKADFDNRPQFTEAEILRSNLAAVVLQMLQLRIGDIRKFPFVDRPDKRLISDGYKLLEELGAVDQNNRITETGRRLQTFPLDPKIARMLLAAKERGCLREMLIIASGLTIQDPRDRPADKQQAADEQHRRFWDEHSDFLSLVNLWSYIESQRQALSQNQLRKLCQKEFLNFLRIKEWRDLHYQLRITIKKLGWKENQEPAHYEAIHRALISGLISNVGQKAEDGEKQTAEKGRKKSREYRGTRNRKFQIFPGSSQVKKNHKWIVFAEIIETSSLFAHGVARVEPEWVLGAAGHLVKHHYYEPHYDIKSGQVKAFVRLTLFGLVLVEKKRVGFNQVDPAAAREVFIRSALVEGNYRGSGEFFKHNQKLVEDVLELEAKSRRRDILVDEQVIFDFYNSVVPKHIANLAGFEHWRKSAENEIPKLLYLVPEQLMRHTANDITQAQFPDQVTYDGLTLPVTYHFDPGSIDDGVSLLVPVSLLHTLPANYLDWVVPGILRDKCIALLKLLPKKIRKQLVPVPQYVDRVLPRINASNKHLTDVLGSELTRIANVSFKPDDWNEEALDDFYRMNIKLLDDQGEVIDQARDIEKLRQQYRQQVRQTLREAGTDIERKDIRQWDFGELAQSVQLDRGGVKITAYPALVDSQTGVDLRVLDNPDEAEYLTKTGLCRLADISLGQTTKYLRKQLLKGRDIGLSVVNLGDRTQVVDQIILAAIWSSCFASENDSEYPLVRTLTQFEQCLEKGKSLVVETAQVLENELLRILRSVVEIKKAIKTNKNALALAFCVADINRQLDLLISPHFLFGLDRNRLARYPVYLQAINIRLEKAPADPHRDRLAIAAIEKHLQNHLDRLQKLGRAKYDKDTAWQHYRWMIEELRVSLFAQTLKTPMPVSEKRLDKQWNLLSQ